jgi:hypothetical protein
MGVDLLAHGQGEHADGPQNWRRGARQVCGIAHELDQRQQVDRVERVRDDGARPSRFSSDGLKPEVEEPITASAGAAAKISSNTRCLISSRSGTLSCTQSAPATASAMLAWKVSAPSGGSARS